MCQGRFKQQLQSFHVLKLILYLVSKCFFSSEASAESLITRMTTHFLTNITLAPLILALNPKFFGKNGS